MAQQPPSQDELVSLFSRNLTLEPVRAVGQVVIPNEEPKIIYASQHYIQPTFVSPPPSTPVVAAVLPQPIRFTDEQTEVINHLITQGVDTSGVSPAQLKLFRASDLPQQTLLINLWRTCRPVLTPDDLQAPTTIPREQHLASLRYYEQEQLEIQAQLEAESAAAAHQPDDTMTGIDTSPLTPVQSHDGSWIQTMSANYMEPYMMSGYEEMARREYEESARRALEEDMMVVKDVPVVSVPQDSVSARPYNPAHSDPVYRGGGAAPSSGFMTVADWRRGQMENEYGRLMNQLNRW